MTTDRQYMTDPKHVVRRNIDWFLRSGIMRPADGFWGVAERILLTEGHTDLARVNSFFPCQTQIAPGLVILEHRRADCNFEVALAFDWASEMLGDPSLKSIADTLVDFLIHRTFMRQVDPGKPGEGLWGWAMQHNSTTYWTDDNAWVITCLFILGRRDRPDLIPLAIAAARALRLQLLPYYEQLDRQGKNAEIPRPLMYGVNLSPHWLGLATLAFAHASAADPQTDYRDVVEPYYRLAPSGPPQSLSQGRKPTSTGLPWTLSEYGYLALAGSIAARQFNHPLISDTARMAADVLVSHQSTLGHYAAEHDEAPIAPHLADLIYTQNWATLGLYHAWKLFGDERYRISFESSLDFLARIQDRTPNPIFTGCWRGMYDTQSGHWSGGDRFEGGARSIYSGWTNAPIAWAFLFDRFEQGLFTKQ